VTFDLDIKVRDVRPVEERLINVYDIREDVETKVAVFINSISLYRNILST
jgi:hypothetical protein